MTPFITIVGTRRCHLEDNAQVGMGNQTPCAVLGGG